MVKVEQAESYQDRDVGDINLDFVWELFNLKKCDLKLDFKLEDTYFDLEWVSGLHKCLEEWDFESNLDVVWSECRGLNWLSPFLHAMCF